MRDDTQARPAQPSSRRPPAELRITDLDTLRVLADPTRMRILEVLVRAGTEPQTVKRVAAALDAPVTKLYYHVNLLEEHGLIRVAESRVVSGIIEKRYLPSAQSFKVDDALLSARGEQASDAVRAAVHAIFQGAEEDIASGLRSGSIETGLTVPSERRMMLSKTIARLSPPRAASFERRFKRLLKDLDVDDAAPDARVFSLVLGFYPLAAPLRDAAESQPESER